jgi:hypothetical protein
MWRWVVGFFVAILAGWGFWRLGTIPPMPESLSAYAEPRTGGQIVTWINHPQADETKLLVLGALDRWIDGEASWLGWLRAPSRWLHERTGSSTGPSELRRVVKSLKGMYQLADEGKSGSASKAFLDEEYRWKERIAKDGAPYKETLRQALFLSYWLYTDIDDRHGAYRIKQQLEDWRLTLSRDETESLALRLLSLDSRIEESVKALAQGRFEEAELAASVSAQGLENVAHDMDRLRPHWSEETANAFGETWSRMSAQTLQQRERIVQAGLDPSDLATVEMNASSTTMTVTTTDIVATTTASTPTTTPPIIAATSTNPTVRRISIIPSSTSLSFGQTISLRAFAIDDDGGRNDVTPRCQFSVAPAGFGQIDKQLFSALANAGSAVISARCQLEDQSYNGSVTVEVRF